VGEGESKITLRGEEKIIISELSQFCSINRRNRKVKNIIIVALENQ
jgi:hypothetical protein